MTTAPSAACSTRRGDASDAIDATTGKPAPSFGGQGWIDLATGIDRDVSRTQLVATSPGVIYKDLLIQGSRVGEGEGAAPGDVRAFDVRTGQLRWVFHTIPRAGEAGRRDVGAPSACEDAGGANSWPGMSVDAARGIVFVPLGSASPDFYGGERLGQNLYANSLVALDAATGQAPLALPDGASRRVGSRSPRGAEPRDA